jgi:site-specific DNA-methyltransferase (cytosine-N4-specific)
MAPDSELDCTDTVRVRYRSTADSERLTMPIQKPPAGTRIAYRTGLGTQLIGDSRDMLRGLPRGSIDLIMTSPPFALLRKKAYGNEDQHKYVAWLAEFGELALPALKDTGSLVIDLGGAYQRGVPVRSLYNYRVLLEFVDNVGYHLAEEFFWHNPSKLPSPIEWVNKRKIRVTDSVNTVWWLSKTEHPKADVRKVLVEYSDKMKQLLKDPAKYYDPTDRPSQHAISAQFGRDNGGAIPKNLLTLPNSESNSRYMRACKAIGLTRHPARFPEGLPKFFIEFLTDEGDLVLDIFSGSNTTGRAAETLGRRWLGCESSSDYAGASLMRFLDGHDLDNADEIAELFELYLCASTSGTVDVAKVKAIQAKRFERSSQGRRRQA